MVVMLVFFGPRHPRVSTRTCRSTAARCVLALFALVMFVLCFTPAPIEPMRAAIATD